MRGREFVEDVIYMIKHAVVPELQDYIRARVNEGIRAEQERIDNKILAEVARMRLSETLQEAAK